MLPLLTSPGFSQSVSYPQSPHSLLENHQTTNLIIYDMFSLMLSFDCWLYVSDYSAYNNQVCGLCVGESVSWRKLIWNMNRLTVNRVLCICTMSASDSYPASLDQPIVAPPSCSGLGRSL